MVLAGIDTGLEGAISIYNAGKLVAVHKMPVISIKKAGKTPKGNAKKKTVVDETAFRDLLLENNVSLAVIEKAQAMRKGQLGRTQGVASSATIMENYGLLRGICVGAGIRYIPVAPITWKTAMLKGVGMSTSDKGASILRAEQLTSMSFGKDHNRAEAVLIGLYAVKEYGGMFGEAGDQRATADAA